MRALVISGGGSRGMYGAGVCTYMLKHGLSVDLYAGVSVGALMAAYLAQFTDSEAAEAVRGLEKWFVNIRTEQVWKHWPLRQLTGLWCNSFVNNSPLRKLVYKGVDAGRIRQSGKKLRIGAVSLTTGNYVVFDEHDPHLQDAVLASSAVPGLFSPVFLGEELWVDGGVKSLTPMKAAIEAGATEIIAVTLRARDLGSRAKVSNAVSVVARSLELLLDEIVDKDIKLAQAYTELANVGLSAKVPVKVTHLRPKFLPRVKSLEFDPVVSKGLYAQGFYDAMEALS